MKLRSFVALSIAASCAACGSSAGSSAGVGDAGGGADGATDSGATDSGATASDAGTSVDGGAYADPKMWLCGPMAAHDYCLDPQTATEVHADGSQTPLAMPTAPAPALDCFYVYPSVDITSAPGNESDFSNLPSILDPVRGQAAPFREVCTVYAPLYHQATYKSYFDANASTYLEKAYADVAAAFREYVAAHNHGRDFVLLGHSQGSHMLRRLIQREIETSADLQKHFVVGILAGAMGDITVPKGQASGGTFKSTPLCTSDTQRGCVITFNTFAKGHEPGSAYGAAYAGTGLDVACTNPAALGGGQARLRASYFLTHFDNPSINPPITTNVTTTFAVYGDFFTGQCAVSANGFSYFEIDAAPMAGDTRTNPIPLSSPYYDPSLLGLHLLDYAFPTRDLLEAVKKRGGG